MGKERTTNRISYLGDVKRSGAGNTADRYGVETFLSSFLRAFLLSSLWQGQLEQKRHLLLYFSQHFDFIVPSQKLLFHMPNICCATYIKQKEMSTILRNIG
jgi:hypothetical protein